MGQDKNFLEKYFSNLQIMENHVQIIFLLNFLQTQQLQDKLNTAIYDNFFKQTKILHDSYPNVDTYALIELYL